MLSLPIGLYPNKRNGIVIGNYEDYQKLPTNKKYLMLLYKLTKASIFVEAQYCLPL